MENASKASIHLRNLRNELNDPVFAPLFQSFKIWLYYSNRINSKKLTI